MREVVRRGEWAQGALRKVIRQHVSRFEVMDDEYLRERGTDVKDLGIRVLAYLQRIQEKKTQFPDNAILVGEEITPAMLGAIPADQLRAGVCSRLRKFPCGDIGAGPGHSRSDGCIGPACI